VVNARATPAARFVQRAVKVESEDGENPADAAPASDPAGPPVARAGLVPQFGSVQGVQSTALLTAVGPLATKLQAMGRQMGATDAAHNATIRSVSQVALAMTAGYVMWSLRGASLLASLLTSLPLWRSLDPLPILEARADRDKAKAVAKRRKKSRRKGGRGGPGDGRDDDEKLGAIVN
jgi:hypothetical protein